MQLSENVAMTVYGPEVAQSSLTSLLDRDISDRTGLEAIERFWVVHDAASISRFYSLTDSTHGAHWPLVVDLFDGRTACVTLWKGQGALGALQGVKGVTQPAVAEPRTIRGRFWCDNPVCNLLHVSDDPSVMQEELQLLRLQEIAGGEKILKETGYAASIALAQHSALWEFSKILIALTGRKISAASFPANGNAKQTAELLIKYILAPARNAPGWFGEVAKRYLSGEPSSIETIKHKCRRLSAWQILILECGLHSNPLWMEVIGTEAAAG